MFPDCHRNRIARFEELAHRTWPCLDETRLGDWILRSAGGFTRRANSALAIGSPGPDLDEALGVLAAWYRARGVEPCVKITPLADPGLDNALDERGWTIATPALVLAARVGPSDPEMHPRVSTASTGSSCGEAGGSLRLESSPAPEWLARLFAWDGIRQPGHSLHEAMFARMPSPRFASWREDGRLAAIAVAVQEDDIVHLYDLVVAPAVRGRGTGTRFLRALLAHFEEIGAREVVLQVLETNTTARALYGRTGFVASHPYHYRIAPPSPCTRPSCGC